MKINFLALLVSCLAVSNFLLAEPIDEALPSRLEVRTAAFFHSSHLFREIYGKSSVDFQVQASMGLCNSMEIWGNVDWFSKKGRSVGLNDPTRVQIANYSLGINFIYPLTCNYSLYAGVGPSLGTLWIKNRSHCGHRRTSKTVIGGVFKAGVYVTLTECLFLDLFVDYLYQPAHIHKQVDIGGVKPGIGIGLSF